MHPKEDKIQFSWCLRKTGTALIVAEHSVLAMWVPVETPVRGTQMPCQSALVKLSPGVTGSNYISAQLLRTAMRTILWAGCIFASAHYLSKAHCVIQQQPSHCGDCISFQRHSIQPNSFIWLTTLSRQIIEIQANKVYLSNAPPVAKQPVQSFVTKVISKIELFSHDGNL